MPEDKLGNNNIIGDRRGLLPDKLEPERSATETAAEAEQISADIDKVVVDFRAQEATENPAAVQELESAAQSSIAQVQDILQNGEDLEQVLINTKTPEYKKAQEYADQVRSKIDDILQSINDERLRGKLELKLKKISKEFWFFCKDMALNDMEEFDYDSKLKMMESKYQKVLAEVDTIASEIVVKDEKKSKSIDETKSGQAEVLADEVLDDQKDKKTVPAEIVEAQPVKTPSLTESNVEEINNEHDQMRQRAYELVANGKKISASVLLCIGQAVDNVSRAILAINDKNSVPLLKNQYDNFLYYCRSMLADKSKSEKLKATLIEGEYEKFIKRMEDIFDAVGNAKESAVPAEKSAGVVLDDLTVNPSISENLVANQQIVDPHIVKDAVDTSAQNMTEQGDEDRRGWKLIEKDPRFLRIAFESLSVYLLKYDSTFADRYNGDLDERGHLYDKEGKLTVDTIVNFITHKNYALILPDSIKKFAELYPEDYKKFREDNSSEAGTTSVEDESSIPEVIEKDLAYLDIDPKFILDKLTVEDMQSLRNLMKLGDTVKINNFYQVKIQEVLREQKKEDAVNAELLKKMSESINAIIQQTIELEAERQLTSGLIDQVLGAKKGQRAFLARKIAKNMVIMGGASLAVGSLGLATGGIGVAATALGMSGLRLILRKIDKNREANISESAKEKEKRETIVDLDKKKAEILQNIFTADNLESLRRQLSGHIANTLREQTSARALEALRAYEQADGSQETKVLDTRFRNVEKELYLNALTKVRAEHPDASPEQQQNMALTIALTLGQHERGENLASNRLEEIRKSKPALYHLIEKYNFYSTGQADQKPAGMTKEEESLWQRSRYDLMSLGIGTAVGAAIRTSGVARVALGAVVGGGLGYKVGEWMEQRDQNKALSEIVKMLEESEKIIKDIEFPSDAIEQLKKDSIFVKSKLDLGLLDSDPLLKSRAENFIHQVQKIELANQESLNKLLATISERTDSRAQQVEDDLQRIGSKIKNRKLWMTIGGAALGGALAWAAGEVFGKKEKEATPSSTGKEAATPPSPGTEVSSQPIEVAKPSSFEDVIDSSKMSGSDSIWRSTHQIFEDHAKELGYTGDASDHDALSQWAENQTANAVQRLNQEQGGNLADLVHDGDKVKIELIDGKPVLSFEAGSGIEASHLPDSNLADLVAGQKFGAGVDHNFAIDPNTGDHFLEIKSGSEVYRVYDWDRDGQPNVVFPDGHMQEMSFDELNKFLAEKNILLVEKTASDSMLESVQPATSEVEAASIAQQQVEKFVSGKGDYSHDLYEAAKNSGNIDDLVVAVVKGENQVQMGALISDLAREQGWSEDKIRVFLNAVRGGEKIDLSSGQFDLSDPQIIVKNMEAFEKSALDSFDKVKDMPAERWMPARIGNDYFNIQKVHSGLWPFRSDQFLIDINGDFKIDAINLDDAAMREAFRRDNFDPKVLNQK